MVAINESSFSRKVPVIFCLILAKPGLSRQISVKFHKNPSNGNGFVPCGRTDMTNRIVAFPNYAKTLKQPDGFEAVLQGTYPMWQSLIILTSSVAFRDTVMAKYFLPPHEQVCWASYFWISFRESSYPSYLYVYELHRMSWLRGRLIWCFNVLDEQSCKETHKIWSFGQVISIAVTA